MNQTWLKKILVAADAAAARLLGLEDRAAVDDIRIAHERGAGRMNLENPRIRRIAL